MTAVMDRNVEESEAREMFGVEFIRVFASILNESSVKFVLSTSHISFHYSMTNLLSQACKFQAI